MVKIKKELPKPTLPKLPPPAYTKPWIILGLDPSLSSTGFTLVTEEGSWYRIGSIRPENRDEQPWIRATAMGSYIVDLLKEYLCSLQGSPHNLLMVYEAPTVGNDYLIISSNLVRSTIRSDKVINSLIPYNQELMVNAATMRNIMGLTTKGNNKGENKEKAWEFISKEKYPGLDSDACDGVLFAQIGLWTITLMKEGLDTDKVPESFKQRFCDPTMTFKKVKATGDKKENGPHGVLHDPYYFFPYEQQPRYLKIKDATRSKGKSLEEKSFIV